MNKDDEIRYTPQVMSKLYYTCPIASAYMAKEFGVQVTTEDGAAITIWHVGTHGIKWRVDHESGMQVFYGGDKFYIHPGSLDIFEPQEGDFVNGDNGDYYCTRYYFYSPKFHDLKKYPECTVDKIIQRNNKPFFMPEVENA